MNNQRLLIYEYKELAEILIELKDLIKFQIIEFNKNSSFNELFNDNNYLIITKNKHTDFKNQLFLNNIPIRLFQLIEKMHCHLL